MIGEALNKFWEEYPQYRDMEAKDLLKFVQKASSLLTSEGQLFLFEYEHISLREYLEYWCIRKGKSRKSAFQKYPYPHVFSLDDLQEIIEEAGLSATIQESISGYRILLGARRLISNQQDC